jgi:hypothetical protein
MALKEDEVNPFISALLDNGLVFQAFHQHAPTQPQVWFVHYRGTGKATDLARALRAAIDVTAVHAACICAGRAIPVAVRATRSAWEATERETARSAATGIPCCATGPL